MMVLVAVMLIVGLVLGFLLGVDVGRTAERQRQRLPAIPDLTGLESISQYTERQARWLARRVASQEEQSIFLDPPELRGSKNTPAEYRDYPLELNDPDRRTE